MQQYAATNDSPGTLEVTKKLSFSLREKDVFYIFQKQKKQRAVQAAETSPQTEISKHSAHPSKFQELVFGGKLSYDRKTGKYWLKTGSTLAENIEKDKDFGIRKFVRISLKEKRIFYANGRYCLRKDIEMRSPSKAAWLICGYKRNGLDGWRTLATSGEKRQEKTLRQVLAEIKSEKTDER